MSELISVLFTACISGLKSRAAFIIPVGGHALPVKYGAVSDEQISDIIHRLNIDSLKESTKVTRLKDISPYKEVLVFPLHFQHRLSALLVLMNDGSVEEDKMLSGYLKKFKTGIEKISRMWSGYSSSSIIPDWKSVAYLDKEIMSGFGRKAYNFFGTSCFEGGVGGDFFDVYRKDELKLDIAIADVAGKGVSAAFPMGEMKDSLRLLYTLSLPEDALAREANKVVFDFFGKNQFATMLYARFDFAENKLKYIRAGHSPILYYNAQKKEAEYLEDEGTGLGIISDITYREHIHAYERTFRKGDMFCFYTDGLFETRNSSGEEYGFDRLKRFIVRHGSLEPQEAGIRLKDELREYSDTSQFSDDQSFIILKAN